MFETTELNLTDHFVKDLGIKPDDLVFMFSRVFGLGKLENGLQTIESAIENTLPRGTLIIPTFSYSWSSGEKFDKNTSCPEMGSFSNHTLSLANYKRTNNPNFSVSIRTNKYNKSLADDFLDVSDDCFGPGSIFDKVVEYSSKNRAWILLLGGAFDDVKYRSTFIHFAQQKVGVPHRYVKDFSSPDDKNKKVKQLVRYFTKNEFIENSSLKDHSLFNFPIEEDFSVYGEGVDSRGLLIKKDFGYYPSRMISVLESVNFFIKKIRQDPYYCIDKSSINL